MQQANIAVLLSGHGFGHLTRTANILTALHHVRPFSLSVVTSAPASLWPDALRPRTREWIQQPCEAAIVQTDDLSVDVTATRLEIEEWTKNAHEHLDRIVGRLSDDRHRPDLVIGDVPPLAFEAASVLGVPSVAIANFSWDWIYERMHAPAAAEKARRAYEQADLLVELTPAAPMPAFGRRLRVGTVGRDASALRGPTRTTLGLAPTDRLALLAMRGPLLSRLTLPPPREGWCFLATQPLTEARRDWRVIPEGMDFGAALAASDIVVAKTGYGILADCAATGRPLLWVSRKGFPEDRVLEAWLADQPWAHRMNWAALADGMWAADLTHAACGPAPSPLGSRPVAEAVVALAGLLN